jgi:predicted Zn-dependent peptidase
MCWLGECEMLLGRVEPVEWILNQVDRVRRSDLTKVARTIIRPDHLSVAIVGPVRSKVQTRIPQILEV